LQRAAAREYNEYVCFLKLQHHIRINLAHLRPGLQFALLALMHSNCIFQNVYNFVFA